MAQLTDEQVDLVAGRIAAGISTASLGNDLLDHFCCYMEERMAEGAGFEEAYELAFAAIAPNGVQEIEEELFFLLTLKKQTNMKRFILISGGLATTMLTAGIILKYLFMPGAGILIVSGLVMATLVFIPTVFVWKAREQPTNAGKARWAIGSLFAICIAFSVMFKVMHWPGANVLGVLSIAILLLLFLPVYFFSGYSDKQTRVNTIVTSVFIIVGCGLYFTLLMTPRAEKMYSERMTKNYLINEQILQREAAAINMKANVNAAGEDIAGELYKRCEALKLSLLKWETGEKVENMEHVENMVLRNSAAADFLKNNPVGSKELEELTLLAARYNHAISVDGSNKTVLRSAIIENNHVQYRVCDALNDLVQLQMQLLQNGRG